MRVKGYRSNLLFLACYGLWIAGIILVLGGSTSGCSSTRRTATAEEMNRLESILNQRHFTFDADFAMPTASQAYLSAANIGFNQIRGVSATNINLKGEGYFIALEGDSVRVMLPYFGIRENITSYDPSEAGIKVRGIVEDYEISADRQGRKVSFFAGEGFERFRFLMTVMPGLQAEVSVFSPQRNVIRYSGTLNLSGKQ